MPTPSKIDLGVLHKDEYLASKKPRLLTLKPAVYLALDGRGAPGGSEFSDRIGALYTMAYTLKMTRKFGGRPDYTIGKLEATYWVDRGQGFDTAPKNAWNWTLLIRTPEMVRPPELDRAVAVLLKRGKSPEVRSVRRETLNEGRCVQGLHLGPYDRVGDTVETLRAFADAQGLVFHGRHHEIYLNDPRRMAPEKLKTLVRVPVKARE